MVPDAYVSRTEVCQQIVDLAYGVEDRDVSLRTLARTGVVSVGQMATLCGLTRQRSYVKLLQWGIEIPEYAVRGVVSKEHANDLLRACVQMKSNKHIEPDLFQRLKEAGSRNVVFHLTGVDIGRKDER